MLIVRAVARKNMSGRRPIKIMPPPSPTQSVRLKPKARELSFFVHDPAAIMTTVHSAVAVRARFRLWLDLLTYQLAARQIKANSLANTSLISHPTLPWGPRRSEGGDQKKTTTKKKLIAQGARDVAVFYLRNL